MFKNKALIPIAVVVFVDLLGFSIILPLLPYYASTFAASPSMIGYLVASYSVFQFLASPILGGMSDKYGRRPLLIYSQFGSFVGYILLGLAHSLPLLFLARIVDGISGGNISIASAYIADVTEPKDRSGAYAIIGIALGLGFLVGPLIGGTLAEHFGYSTPAYVAAGFSFSSALLTIFYLKEHQHARDAVQATGLNYYTRIFEYLKDANLRSYLFVFLFFALPFSLYVSMASLYMKLEFNATPQQVGLFLAFVGLLGIIYQGALIRPLVKKIGDLKLMRIGMLAMGLGIGSIYFVTEWWQLLLTATVFSFGTGVTRPTLSSLITSAAPPTRKGGVLGVSSMIESASRSLSPILGGWIIALYAPNVIGLAGAILTFIGIYFAFSVKDNSNLHEVPASFSAPREAGLEG
jgi:DHA1 family tetracycline resistance protein-like MFS transporter